MGRPNEEAAAAAALRLRRHPAITVEHPASKQIVDPFGDGNTIRVPGGKALKELGDSE
jgi:hypothetical protein